MPFTIVRHSDGLASLQGPTNKPCRLMARDGMTRDPQARLGRDATTRFTPMRERFVVVIVMALLGAALVSCGSTPHFGGAPASRFDGDNHR